jgi:hypothetical protein
MPVDEQETVGLHLPADRPQARVRDDPVMKEYLARWRALLAGPPVVEVYRITRP